MTQLQFTPIFRPHKSAFLRATKNRYTYIYLYTYIYIYIYIYIYSEEWTDNDSELLIDPFRMKKTLYAVSGNRTRVPWITRQVC